ncbi:MAG: hypothetical protein QM647_12140 [Asticcacaulis sp.]|uniref:hypothetical protein n=1 Tax=Asticcacaulis sp. TaxID=1872648 RepID=UPI0039E26690
MSGNYPDNKLPVPAGPVIDRGSDGAPRRSGAGRRKAEPDDATYAAQLLSGGEKRGLRGGPETLERAKSTYLKSEYSGPNDRRPAPGRVTKTEI